MLSKYIKELIENNNRIIIPDFGAFMVQTSAQGKQISFNDFLKFNDGLLINQIIKTEKISKNEATDKVKDFIKSIEKSFGEKKAYELNEIGFLYRDDHGNIKFSVDKPAGKNTEKSVATDVKPTIVLDEKPAEKKAELNKTETETPKTQTKAATSKKPEANKPEQKTEAPKINPVTTTAKKPEPKTAIPKTPTAKTATTNNTNSNNTLQTIFIIVAAVIILGGGTWAVLTFDLVGKIFNKNKKTELVEQVAPLVDTTPAADTVIMQDTTPEPEPIVEEEPQIDPNVKKYYIVAGSFKVPSNAENFNQKLIDEGYNSEIVMRNNGFQVVTYKTLYDWDNALAEWKKMRNTNAETWIFIK